MICGYCGTELPATALFCGECGRSLASSTGRTAPVATLPSREPVAFATPVSDTSIIELEQIEEIEGATVVTRSRPAPAPVVETPPAPVETPLPPVPEPAETPPAPVTITDPPQPAIPDPWTPPARPPAPAPEVDLDFEQTRIVSSSRPAPGLRFVLQFSTGESVTVTGTGLVGRNPVKEPAEYFDHLVTIVDPGKSVSKTHLEFGSEAGAFWVSDRFSGNGTSVREPDSEPRRCEPGRRYRIARGTRVTMGEQFFVVS